MPTEFRLGRRQEHSQTLQTEETLDAPSKEAHQSANIPASRQAITDRPMATSPTSHRGRQPLPAPEKDRKQYDARKKEARAGKRPSKNIDRDNNRATTSTRAITNTTKSERQITVATKTGDKISTASSEDLQEQDNVDKILEDHFFATTKDLTRQS